MNLRFCIILVLSFLVIGNLQPPPPPPPPPPSFGKPIEGFKEPVSAIGWNGKYFLLWYDLAGTDTSALASFEDSTLNWESFLKGWQWPVISSVCWNGEYWLVGFKYIVAEKEMALVRLEEKGIMDLTEEFKKSLLEAPRKTELGFSVFLISIILLAFLERKS